MHVSARFAWASNRHHPLRQFNLAVDTYLAMHGQRASVVDNAGLHPPGAAHQDDDGAPCASHASGVEACRETGEAPQGSQAGRADGANSIGSGVAGPYNPPSRAGEQPSEVSKPRHYKHHSSSAKPQRRAATKRPHADKQDDAPQAVRHHGNATAAHASTLHPPPAAQPPVPNVDVPPPVGAYQPQAAYMTGGHPMMMMQDPKFWQAVQAGLMPPPPMPPFFAFGSPWQLLNAMASQQMLSAAAASTWGGPAPSTQSLAPTTTYAAAPAGGPTAEAAGSNVGSSAMARACKEQIRHMAAAGLPSEAQIEVAARSKATELGEPALAQMLMAWYYAGYFTGQQEQGKESPGGG